MTHHDISVHSPVAKPLIDLVAVRQLHVARLFPVAEAGSACLVHLFPAHVERQTLTARFQMCRAINTRFLCNSQKRWRWPDAPQINLSPVAKPLQPVLILNFYSLR